MAIGGRAHSRALLTASGVVSSASEDIPQTGTIEPTDPITFVARFLGRRLGLGLIAYALTTLAMSHGVTAGHLALTCLLTDADDVIAVPGTRHPGYLTENVAAVDIRIGEVTRSAIEAAVPGWGVAGGRTSPADADIEQP